MPKTKRSLKVFLCHARADAASVRALYARLTKDGVDAWLDKEKLLPGQDWELEIRKAVREADVVVVCLSKQFNQAGFRQKEVRWALDTAMEQPEGDIFIIPARLEECENLESLRKWQWVDLFKADGYEILMRALHVQERSEQQRRTVDKHKENQQSSQPLELMYIPHNLPPRNMFVGREKEKRQLLHALCHDLQPRLISIDGMGGIGKTALALEVAYQCLGNSRGDKSSSGYKVVFDGFIWTTAKNRELTLNGLLDNIARVLDRSGIAQKTVKEKLLAVNRILQSGTYLLIVDNFETISDERIMAFLIQVPEPSKVLITTRKMKMMEQYMITLSPLKEPEGLRLIHNEANRLGLSLFKKEQNSELLSLYKTTGGTPLAIKWAMGQTKQKGQSLKTVLKALQDASSSVFDNIFANSWLLLTPDSRKLLTIMPFFATSASKDSLEAVSDLHGLSFDNAISQLVEMSLLEVLYDDRLAQQRYGVHPLTRTFVGEKIKSKTEFNAQRNLVDFYLRFVEQYGVQWGVGGGTTYTSAFNKKYSDPSHDERIVYLEAEIPNILDVIKRCWEHQLLKEGLEIFLYICDILIIYNYWSDVLDFSEKAIVQAKELGDEVLAARLRISPIARIYRYQGLDNLAKKQVEQAELDFMLSKERKDIDVANVNYYLGCIAQAQGETEIAQKHLESALVIMKELGEERHSCFMMVHLAEVAVQKRELIVAHSILESALILARQHNDNEVLSYLLRVFSRVVNGQNDPKAAKEFLREAILLTNIGRDKALMQLELAQIQVVTGEKTDKTELLNAQAIFKKLDMESNFQEVQVLLVECN